MAPLTFYQQLTCYLTAAGVLIVQIVAKKVVPLKPFEWIASKFSLEKDSDENPVLKLKKRVTEILSKRRSEKAVESRESLLKE